MVLEVINQKKKINNICLFYTLLYGFNQLLTNPSPFYAFKEFTPEKCGEFYDILYFLDLHTNELSEVKRLISKSKWIKIL